MIVTSSVRDFVAQMNNEDGIIVNEQPKLDIDIYLQNYAGRTRFDRLLLIGKTCVPLCVDALKRAVAEAKAGVDVSRYIDAWECIRIAAPEEPESQKDQEWIDRTERRNKAETARLEAELKGYKHNLIKESIRMGNEDLGRHFENIGMLAEAAESYNRMRQDVTATRHIVDCGMNLLAIGIYRRDWTVVLNNTSKVTGVLSGEDDRKCHSFTKLVSGIALLGQKRYREAGVSFLQLNNSLPCKYYNHIATPNDIAIYGGLLALATMNRQELQVAVLENQPFRSFLEHEPHIRKAISLFVNGRYSICLSILASYRNDCLLDIYLHRHVSTIYSLIRNKCIMQYFVPFSCVNLNTLSETFALEGDMIENELVSMIRQGNLKARIDSKNKLLIAVQPDPRIEMQKHALRLAHQYELDAKERLRRLSIVSAGLEVTGKRPSHPGRGIGEVWYDGVSSDHVSGVSGLEG